jgi:hypothetical protein
MYLYSQPNKTVVSIVANWTQYNFTVPYTLTVTDPTNEASKVTITGFTNATAYGNIMYNVSDVTAYFKDYDITTLNTDSCHVYCFGNYTGQDISSELACHKKCLSYVQQITNIVKNSSNAWIIVVVILAVVIAIIVTIVVVRRVRAKRRQREDYYTGHHVQLINQP